jgi:hypothetical protein
VVSSFLRRGSMPEGKVEGMITRRRECLPIREGKEPRMKMNGMYSSFNMAVSQKRKTRENLVLHFALH